MLDYPTSVLRVTGRFAFCPLPTSGTRIRDRKEESGITSHERRWCSSIATANKKSRVIQLPIVVYSKVVDRTFQFPDCENGTSPSTDLGVLPLTPDFVRSVEGCFGFYSGCVW